ncbi:rhodanese-like domain-containing protein [Bacteroidota bacterium]
MNKQKNNIGTFLITIILFSVLIFFSFRIFTTDYDAKNETISKTYDKDTVSENITVMEAFEMINENLENPSFVILDVRTPEEYNSGHIENSVLIDYRSDTFREEINELDKNNTYMIYCRTGGRSAYALNMMKELGFDNAYNMLGGITLWEKESYPIEK